MANLSKNKNPMPAQNPEERNKTFDEVALGYTEALAKSEAERCLNCKKPYCVDGCPVNVQIPEFIKKIADGDYEGAYSTIKQTNTLPAVCGRVCPQESQCEAECIRGRNGEPVAIGRLERFAADRHNANNPANPEKPTPNGHKAAVVGSGPAGLACAGTLANLGWDVTIYEALHTPGGVLVYGIPEFRLPKSVVKKEIDDLIRLGVKIVTNVIIGKTLMVEELFEDGFEAVFLGSGAGLPKFMGIPGENLNGVYSANEYLTRVNLMKAYKNSSTPVLRPKKVAVVGGGNVAMDSARCALRMGAEEVRIVYRRSGDELPARAEEVAHAKEEGIIFNFLTNPVEITGDEKGFVNGLVCVNMVLGEHDSSGRRAPAAKPETKHTLEVDCVIMAIGTNPNPLIKTALPGIETHKWGGIITDDDGKTSSENVYAGGDAVTGAATVILAMGAGKKAALAIDKAIRGKER
ncbi:MAG: NADPH-dependent glutamate synthase [Eubacteriales bacterium]